MPTIDRLAALVVVVVWGINFVVMKIGLQDVPPLLLGGLRFLFVAIPAVFFLPRPKVPLRLVLGYGLSICFAQFAFLFSAIHAGMPAGLASLVLQAQALFTLGFSAIFFGERLHPHNYLGLGIAFSGLALLALASTNQGGGIPVVGFVLTLAAAFSWATGNMVTKAIGRTDILAFVAWSALVPILPYLAVSALFEGTDKIAASLTHLTGTALAAIAYLAYASTFVGYSLWGRLVGRHPLWKVAPLTLLVPVIGLTSSWAILGEALSVAQMVGAGIVLAGLSINVLGARLLNLLSRRTH